MKNRDLFVKDPHDVELLNNGVAKVMDTSTAEELRTLRFELENFVCEGQYARGLERILSAYLNNLDHPEQPAVWVSGFFGSGKSHLVKMLQYFWLDFHFPDGASARGLPHLPTTITDLLRELATEGKRKGGLHAAAGTLGAGAREGVRLALLSVIFRSADLPEDYPVARFVMWLKRNGYFHQVKDAVEAAGRDWHQELRAMYVSPVIADALLRADPSFAPNPAEAKSLLKTQFPLRKEVSNTDMTAAIRDALTVDGEFPCTLIVLDEVQQYIGENMDRSYMVQEVTEACSKTLGNRILFLGTGQNALTDTPYLQKLMARFKVPIELSDADVETVTRKMVLAKKPDQERTISALFSTHSGEISRHLSGTKIEPRTEDQNFIVADYPLLPVRRRFWEKVLRAVDKAGTTGQLRTQLKIVYEAVRDTADRPVGTVIPGDYLYDQISTNMIQSGVLLREIDEIIRKQRDGTADGTLRSRLCALIFLISKLSREPGSDVGVRATPDVLADLLVEDLKAGSTQLRKRIPELLNGLVQGGELMQVEQEYRLQTRESSAWDSAYREKQSRIFNDSQRMADLRSDILRAECGQQLKDVKLTHGKSKVPRKIELHFTEEAPQPSGQTIPVWIRDGWTANEKAVLAEARAAGTDSPLICVYIQRRAAEELKKTIASLKAAEETLQTKGIPTTPEGLEARQALQTRLETARTGDSGLESILADIFGGTRVIQGGGNEVTGMLLAEKVKDAAQDSLVRMYPQFDLADDARWGRVFERAKQGDGNALEAIGHTGDIDKHPVCGEILSYVAAGKKGGDIRKYFTGGRYGWPQDAVDGALFALLATGHLRATYSGRALEVGQLERAKIGSTDFRMEIATVSAKQRIAMRKLFQAAGVACKSNEEATKAPVFVKEMLRRADEAGGDPPLPARPNTTELEDIGNQVGTEQIIALFDKREELAKQAEEWLNAAALAKQRLPRWQALQELLQHADGMAVVEEVAPQVAAIVEQRSLLSGSDPVPPLCKSLTAALRTALTTASNECTALFDAQNKALTGSEVWQKLDTDKRAAILAACGLTSLPKVKVAA
ncbi:MAG: BREX system P-loop protein BrxC, partial [Planctomycetota bacterium]